MSVRLLNIKTNEGLRTFYCHPGNISWRKLLGHLKKLKGVRCSNLLDVFLTEYLGIDAAIKISFRSYDFIIHDSFGEFWFYSNLTCPEEILFKIAEHCEGLNFE